MSDPDSFDVVVVGTGFTGIYALHRCQRAGWSVLGIEAGDGVGGTWYWNRYPGARCDVESVDYSYSFDGALQASWRWSENYATQPEISSYLEHVTDRFGLRDLIVFGEEHRCCTLRRSVGAHYRRRDVGSAHGSSSWRQGACRRLRFQTCLGWRTSLEKWC